jgi:hypothetical protein
LSIYGNHVGDEGVGAICEAIQSNKETKLASLNFGINGISPVGANAVAAMVAVMGGLTSLDLSGNQLCGLDHNGRGTYTAEGITAIADALRVNGGLTKISLARNNLEEEGTKAICEALEQNTTLKELDISGHREYSNIGGSAGAKHVAKMVRVNGALTSIVLSYNQLCGLNWEGRTAEGITAIADALRVNGALTSISLRGNKLGDEGWGAIFAAICGNKDSKIMSLDASGENIGLAGGKLIAKELAAALGVNGALTVTNLLRNQLDEASAKMLAEVAKQKGISLCGIRRDQTTANFSNQNLELPDVILLASDLSQADVTGALIECKLLCNPRIGEEGEALIRKAMQGKAGSKLRI